MMEQCSTYLNFVRYGRPSCPLIQNNLANLGLEIGDQCSLPPRQIHWPRKRKSGCSPYRAKMSVHCVVLHIWTKGNCFNKGAYVAVGSADCEVNPLNAELKPICHLLVLLGDLTFMDPCIVSIFQYISNKMQRYIVYLYLESALHVSGGTSTHHQEHIQMYLQHLVFVTPLLLSAAIVEELELVWVCCVWRTPSTAHSNGFQVFHYSGR